MKDDTCVDEVIDSDEISLEDINLLEERIFLSSKLHELKLDQKVTRKVSKQKLIKLSNDSIKEMIQLEEDNLLTDEERSLLLYNEGLINNWLSKEGNYIATRSGYIEVKSKVLEAINKNNPSKKLKYSDYNKINMNKADHKKGIYYNEAIIEDVLYNLTDNIGDLVTLITSDNKDCIDKDIYGNLKYSKDRNQRLNMILSSLKWVLNTDYKINTNLITKSKKLTNY